MFQDFMIFNQFYIENFALIAAFLMVIGLPLYFVKNNSVYYQTAWSSVVSWFYVLPVIFVLFALPEPGPIVVMGLFSIYSLKTFFQMVGIYHRGWFVNLSYLLIVCGTYFVYVGYNNFFTALPMMALAVFIFIAILRNSFENMVQYIGLSLIGFSIYGWFYLHGAKILTLDFGLFTLIYLYALSELAIALSSSLSLKFGRFNLRNRINSKIKLEGFIISTLITVVIAWSWRRMLPDNMQSEWLAVGLICSIFSTLGDLFLSVIRKDLKIKDQGVFIIGRGDLLSRANKVIFVFPAYYYFVEILRITVGL